jgi:hypothetical protein
VSDIQGHQLITLSRAVHAVQEILGGDFTGAACSCLDEDDEAPHAPLCAWSVVSPVLEALKEAVDHQPDAAARWMQRAKDLVVGADEALEQKANNEEDGR